MTSDRPMGNPILAELTALIVDRTCEAAAERVSLRRGLRRGPPTTPWTSLFSPPPGWPVLELGAGFGDDTLALASLGVEVIAAVPDETNAGLLTRRLEEAGQARVSALELGDLDRLPMEDGSLAGIAFPHAADSGFGLTRRGLERVAREFARVVSPGGLVLVGLPSALGSLLRRGMARLAAGDGQDTLNRAVKRRPTGLATSLPTPQLALAALGQAGFRPEAVWAPLPDEEGPIYVVPLHDPDALAYFLTNVIRRNTALSSGAAWLAGRRPVLSRFGRLAPYHYLCLRAQA